MKFVLPFTVLFAGVLVQETSACDPWAGIGAMACFVDDNCQGTHGFLNFEPQVIQTCFSGTNSGLLSRPIGSTGFVGPVGGGGSCICTDPDGNTYCAQPQPLDPTRPLDEVTIFRRLMSDTTATFTDGPLTKRFVFTLASEHGEPHIKTWGGKYFDWHGECDTVFMDAPDFAHGKGLLIHVRTKIVDDYSFIETAAIRIGDEILEVAGWGQYFLNGVHQAELPSGLSDYAVTHKQENDINHNYVILLGEGVDALHIRTHKDIVSIEISGVSSEGSQFDQWFTSSRGLMGEFKTGRMLARDGQTVLHDAIEFGQEWQVTDSEPKLFQDPDRAPQFPKKCSLPSVTRAEAKRRLGESITEEAARKACSHFRVEDAIGRCMFDVIATNDLSIADSWAY